MALHVPKAPGVPQMLKDGARVSTSRITYELHHGCNLFTFLSINYKYRYLHAIFLYNKSNLR